jgi:uncharacterized membrane protein YkoI
MIRSRKLVTLGVAVVALGAAGVGVSQAVGDDSDEQVTGPRAEAAKRAAVEAAGGGRVTGIEREDEGKTAWEVEVVRDDGREVEVALGENLERVAIERDDDDSGDRDGDSD